MFFLTDKNGYLQMTGCKLVVDGKNPGHKYNAIIKSEACPESTGLETKIKVLWSEAGDL